MKLHYADPQPGATGYGWATCNRELQQALASYFQLTSVDPDIVFTPVDSAFRPLSKARGRINVCLNFFESPLEPCARENAAKFDICFVGSTWCQQRCAEAGIHNTAVLIQGVDGAIFSPRPPRKPDGQFRIFSGGKFEYRKGQDLVIAAFREFTKTHPDAHLVCAWFNPWPQLFGGMHKSEHIKMPMASFPNQESFFSFLLTENGVPFDRFTILPQLSQSDFAREMANTDCGLFPNRCEGGNNLVLQEYASLGRKVIANTLTGHADVDDAIGIEIPAEEDENKWAVQEPKDIAGMLRCAHALRERPLLFTPPAFTWEDAAETVALAIGKLTCQPIAP